MAASKCVENSDVKCFKYIDQTAPLWGTTVLVNDYTVIGESVTVSETATIKNIYAYTGYLYN